MSVSVAPKLREDHRGGWLDPEIEQLLKTAVDDLVKYKIVRFLQEHRAAGDAVFFASSLGFHSVPKTSTALEELAAAGVVHRWKVSGHDEAHFCLTSDQTMRRRLSQLCSISAPSPSYGEMMRRLSAASLHRAEAAARHNAG